jgi:hypothetical protein
MGVWSSWTLKDCYITIHLGPCMHFACMITGCIYKVEFYDSAYKCQFGVAGVLCVCNT